MTPDNDENALRESVRRHIGRHSIRWIKENIYPAEDRIMGVWVGRGREWKGDVVNRVCQEEAEAAIARIEAKKGGKL